MNLLSQLTAFTEQSRGLPLPKQAALACQLAKQLERAGEYEAACEALSDFWPERHGSPKLEGLDSETTAHILLRVGALAGWLGSVDQAMGGQETARDLITRSIDIFEKMGRAEGALEAKTDLALCYWREGAFDNARDILADVLIKLGKNNGELKAIALIRAGTVEIAARRSSEALRLYYQAATILETSQDHDLKGRFHNHFAVLFNNLGTAEHREDYIDRALIEYAAASFHFEQAGHSRE